MAIKTTVENNDVLNELLEKYNLEIVLEPKKEKKTKKQKKSKKK